MSPLHALDYQGSLPELFTNPFDYRPSGVVVAAADDLMRYITGQHSWQQELSRGKMFGVLVVRDKRGGLYYLAAFSGNLGGETTHSFFVPPIFDLHSQGSFFKEEESRITAINREIEHLQKDHIYHQLLDSTEVVAAQNTTKIAEYKSFMRECKSRRKLNRRSSPTQEQLSDMERESQHQKAELRRLERRAAESILDLERQIAPFEHRIQALKTQRQQLSQELQIKLFRSYMVVNHQGEERSMYDIFDSARSTLPPAGAGECAAPKILHYAYTHDLLPVAMGEFWVGDSPRGEVRRHGEYYAACEGKCRVILGYMLDGMELESPADNYTISRDLRVIYQDSYMAVVDKPCGMLSVKGRVSIPSVEERLPQIFPQHPNAKVVHRLDQDTSGLLLVAFSKDVYSQLQRQFAERKVYKRYIAILDGALTSLSGEINLPLLSDYEIRPRQRVDHTMGLESITLYRVLAHEGSATRVELTPLTGRTHQLRVHCAHSEGLSMPILGDRLYGRAQRRLMLHAEWISFVHPVECRRVEFYSKAEF